MKRATALINMILMMAAILGCGGGSGGGAVSSSGTSKVTIAIAGLRASALSSASVQASPASIQFTISAPDMDTILRSVAVTGDTMTESFVVPNGSNRHFIAKALASDTTTVLSEGDTFADLDGTPKDINIAMGVEIAGEWTFTFIGQDGIPATDFITFTQTGNAFSLSGTTASTSLLKSVFAGNGTIYGNDIQFVFNGSGCGNTSTVAGTGTVYSDGSLGGTFTQTGGCGNGSGTWKAVSGHIAPPSTQGSVAGTVTDEQTTSALSGVTVKLFQQGSLITSGTTGSNGVYSLAVPAGSGYSIEFSKSGYTTKTVDNITIASNSITTVNAALSSTIPPPSTQGSVAGTVTDEQTTSALSGVTVKLFQQGSLITSGTTGSNGVYSLTVPAGSGYSIEFSKSGYTTKTVDNITIASNSITTVNAALSSTIPPPNGQGTVTGVVTDTLGNPLAGVTVRLLSGNTVITTITNQQDGTYSLTGPAGGGYTLEFSKAGYITFTAGNITITANSTTANMNATLTQSIQEGQTRIILTWGAEPSDLDSHLTGPIPNSTSRFHIFYGDPCYPSDSCTFDNDGNTIAGPNTDALLDHDDTTSFGPETTTIVRQYSGVYKFFVHDFTNGGITTSTALSNSVAQVKVYQGSNLVATFNVPTNQVGTVWTVFELNGSAITPINTITSDETVIQSASQRASLKKAGKKAAKK